MGRWHYIGHECGASSWIVGYGHIIIAPTMKLDKTVDCKLESALSHTHHAIKPRAGFRIGTQVAGSLLLT